MNHHLLSKLVRIVLRLVTSIQDTHLSGKLKINNLKLIGGTGSQCPFFHCIIVGDFCYNFLFPFQALLLTELQL